MAQQNNSRAHALLEAVDGLMLRPLLRDKFFSEKNKYRRQSSRPSLAHMTRVVRELVDTQNFDPSTNPWTIPTIGKDANGTFYDPNPTARLAPRFKRELSMKKARAEGIAEAFISDKKKKGLPPQFVSKKKQAGFNPQTQDVPDEGPEATLQQNTDAEGQNQDFVQQQTNYLQQQGLPPGQVSPQDMMAGSPQPQLPELPGDLRKDPSWEGNRAALIAQGIQTQSQRIANRYDLTKEPLETISGPRTHSYKLRMMQTRWGDATRRVPRTNNGERI